VLGVLGTVKDLNGQPLESPLQLAFSTGPALDSGLLSGTVVPFQGKPAAGAFAALYPRGADLRARFQHLTHRHDSVVVAAPQPDPLKEKPAYIAPADSLGRFSFKRLRPGRYGLLGFQDINGDLDPNVGSEALAIGPSVDIAGASGDPQNLALAQYDTVPLRLVEARWVNERMQGGRALGTVRLKFNRPPHPVLCLRKESYGLRKASAQEARNAKGGKGAAGGQAAKGAPLPVADICVNPVSGEIEIATAPLEPDSQYVAICAGLRDPYGNPVDTARNSAVFKADTARDTAKTEMIFLGPRKISGEVPRLPVDHFLPSRGMLAYYPRLLTDSTLAWLRANLIVKVDTMPAWWSLARVSHHEFSLQFAVAAPLKGQRLALALKPDSAAPAGSGAPAPGAAPKPAQSALPGQPAAKDTAAKPAPPQPVPVAAFTLADASKLGSLKFKQDKSAYGSRLVIRGIGTPWEFTRVTPASEEVMMDSLPEGLYAVDYFRDTNGDGVWHPGSLAPWAIEEPYVQWADSVEVKGGGVNRGDGKRPGAAGAANPAISADSSKTGGSSPGGERKLAWPPLW
jgi:hypothetical protein